MTPAEKDRGGRPSKLTADVADRIILSVRAGQYVETSAAAAGISKDTLYRWLKEGARDDNTNLDHECKHCHGADYPNPSCRVRSHHRAALVRFSDAVARAMAHAEQVIITSIGLAGEQPSTKTITKSKQVLGANNTVVTLTETTTESIPPDWRAQAWRAERKFSKRWGQRAALEVSGPDKGAIPVDVRRRELVDQLRRVRGERVDDAEQVSDDAARELMEG